MTIRYQKELGNRPTQSSNLIVFHTFTRWKGWWVCLWFFLRLVTYNEVLLEDMQQLGGGATLDAHGERIIINRLLCLLIRGIQDFKPRISVHH